VNLAITAVPDVGESIPDLKMTRMYAPGLSDEEILATHSVLTGSPSEMADTLSSTAISTGHVHHRAGQPHRQLLEVIAELR